MPFLFVLPTTSSVLLTDFFTSVTHPSLPLVATTKRSLVRDALKKYKRLPSNSRDASLSGIRDALDSYLPLLLALNTASGFRDVRGDFIDVEVLKPLEVEWRTARSPALPGQTARSKLVGIHFEIAYVYSTLASVHFLLARSQLKVFYGAGSISQQQRENAVRAAMGHLWQAHGILHYLSTLPSIGAERNGPADIQPSTISALASLALAEANIAFVAKDDPYAAAVSDDRDEQNNDWMFRAPTIPKVRATLFARICLGASEHASQSHALLSREKVPDDLLKYVNDLRRTARAKAIRFFAIDAELRTTAAEALGWIGAAKPELGLTSEIENGRRRGFRGLRQTLQERREDKKIEKGGEWGLDAGRYEEARIVEMLETKWERENSTINVQAVPPSAPLIAAMGSGRDCQTPPAYQPPTLDSESLAQMRAPLDPDELAFRGNEEDSGDEGFYGRSNPVGAFPGTEPEYTRSATSNTYY